MNGKTFYLFFLFYGIPLFYLFKSERALLKFLSEDILESLEKYSLRIEKYQK